MQCATAEHQQVLAAAGVQMSKSRAGRLVAQDPPTPVDRVACAKLLWVFAVIAVMLVLCLFGDSQVVRASRWGGLATRTMEATFRDLATQWMVVLCCAIYFATFTLLERRATARPFWNWVNPQVWATAFLVLAALHYGLNYKSASGSTYALMLLGGVVLGKGAAVWAAIQSRKQKVENGNSLTAQVVGVLLLLLAAAALFRSETGLQFQYRGQGRWTGPWDNPNIFGMLMGVGCVLAAGQLVWSPKSKVQSRWIWRRLRLVLFAAAGVVCGIGLIKSYSRGAWFGTAVGLGYLGWCWWRARTCLAQGLNRGHLIRPSAALTHPSGPPSPIRWARDIPSSDAEKECYGEAGEPLSCVSSISWLQRNWVPLLVVLLSVVILAFWNFRHTEQRAARRAFSAVNINDFSWRNRLAAWEGALQMMASKPLVGFGWNQAERIYDQFYRMPKVTESAAMQMNDYFTLGTTLGIPALVCFLAYVGLSLTWNVERKDRTSPQPSPQRGEGEKQAPVRRESDSLPINLPLDLVGTRSTASPSLQPEACDAGGTRPYRAQREIQGEVRDAESSIGKPATGWKRCPTPEWLRAICRAGAIVLLVGFWFDGGLFKLATGSVFWILLELGRNEEVELFESESVKIPDAP